MSLDLCKSGYAGQEGKKNGSSSVVVHCHMNPGVRVCRAGSEPQLIRLRWKSGKPRPEPGFSWGVAGPGPGQGTGIGRRLRAGSVLVSTL